MVLFIAIAEAGISGSLVLTDRQPYMRSADKDTAFCAIMQILSRFFVFI